MTDKMEILGTVEGIAERFAQAHKGLLSELAEVASGKKQAAHWMRWNALKLVNIEKAAEEWLNIADGIKRQLEMDGEDEDIVKYLTGLRDGFIERILGWKQGCSRSTNQMANLIKDEELTVLQSIVGRNCIDTNTLTYMLG